MLLMWFGMTGGIFFGWYFGAGNTDSGKEQPGVPFSLETQDAVPFTVIDIPGKGKGAIASRDIKQGELIIEERPLFLVPPTINSSPTDFIWDKLEDVTEEQRESFFNLSFVNFPADKDPETDLKDVALAIFETNAVSAGSSVGIFPRMARLNHGCSSAFSAVYTYREKEGSLVVYAIKDVQKGTELLITYSDTKQPREQRRAYLQKQYGFHCTCSVCSLPDDVSKASDNRLVEMNRHQSRLSQWIQRTVSGPEAIEHVRSIWKLGDEEGYWSERGRLAGDAVFVAAGHSECVCFAAGHLGRSWRKRSLSNLTDIPLQCRCSSRVGINCHQVVHN
ncbi:SET domain-containing protein [Coprinopsis marcescibilis]|uniref:SET domain-containing protein n=1 Tax=Coprinopsis marcescibilis TaxID=230819 RepID=A0A5C3KIJ4_COPMA|nr:SET domain-containing protein [Coprinopsis marcescibilis]